MIRSELKPPNPLHRTVTHKFRHSGQKGEVEVEPIQNLLYVTSGSNIGMIFRVSILKTRANSVDTKRLIFSKNARNFLSIFELQ